jgi:hypothetical protein
MENLQIGKWLITEDGIEWTGTRYKGYYISRERLLQEGLEKRGTYDWLLHLAHKNWVTEQDIYTLNTAFIIALELFEPKYKRSNLSFVKTLEAQQKIIDIKKTETPKAFALYRLSDLKAVAAAG